MLSFDTPMRSLQVCILTGAILSLGFNKIKYLKILQNIVMLLITINKCFTIGPLR